MPGAAAETLAAALLAACLFAALTRPFRAADAFVAVPAAALVVATGVVPRSVAGRTLRELGPTIAFLAAVLVLGHLCAEAGVFDFLGAHAVRAARGDTHRFLAVVVVLAAVVTAVLTLDATIVLLTPVVLAATARSRAARPLAFACARLANSGSLLLPVSNLTNLLAFAAADISFGQFTALMALPWLVVCAGEWAVFRVGFREDLVGPVPSVGLPPQPRYALAVLAVTVAGFVAFSMLHVAVAWAAVGGCLAMLIPRALRRDVDAARLVREASPAFCAFVLALAIVVAGLARHGMGAALARALPAGSSLPSLLAVTFVSAALATAMNNLPATLVLLPLVTGNPAAVLAMLVGVNVGPNAAYPGSLATLLWRRIVPEGRRPSARTFHLTGAATVPALMAAATTAMWATLQLVGT